jgi:hypothetical protein
LKNVGDVDVAQGKNGVEAVNLIREHNSDQSSGCKCPASTASAIKKLLDRKVTLPQIVLPPPSINMR